MFVWVAVSDVGKPRQSTAEEKNYIMRHQHDFSVALASLVLERHSCCLSQAACENCIFADLQRSVELAIMLSSAATPQRITPSRLSLPF